MSLTSVGPPAGWRRRLPGLATIRAYRPGWLPRDIAAGMALTAILVPVGMSYAEAAGLPAIHGLYATIVPLVVYSLVGPSRILVLGPDSSLAAIIASTIVPVAAGDPERLLPLAAALAVMAGLLCLAAGLLRMGFLTELLSLPIRQGYLHGIALTVLVGQLPRLFGFSPTGTDLVSQAQAFVQGVAEGRTDPTALVLGLSSIAVILAFRRWVPTVPGVLVAVVGATFVTWLLGLGGDAGIAVVGPLPQGLPSFALPAVDPSDVTLLIAGAAAIALVSMADISVLSRTFAARRGEQVDQDQELVALGAVNVATGLFQGFPVTSSASRTPVAEAAGAHTQVAGLVGAIAVGVLLVALPGLTADLPSTTLAAIVIVACLAMVDLPGLRRMWSLRPTEALLSLVCFLAVAVLGVVQGILLAVLLALLSFVWRAWRPYSAVLGRVDGVKGYHDVTRYPSARVVPGLVMFRWDAPLFFANAGMFRERVLEAVGGSPEPARWVVVAAEPVTDVDLTAAAMLGDLITELAAGGVALVMAELKDPVKDRLKRYGLYDRVGIDRFHPTLGSAVDAYLDATGVDWTDWQDRMAAP